MCNDLIYTVLQYCRIGYVNECFCEADFEHGVIDIPMHAPFMGLTSTKGGEDRRTLFTSGLLSKSYYQNMSHNDPYSSNLHRNEHRVDCTNESVSVF